MKVLLVGAHGQLGSDLKETVPATVSEIQTRGRDTMDVSDRTQVRAALQELRPDLVLSTAAYHMVDLCQTEVQMAFQVNAAGAGILAQESARIGARLVWYSTDYVFDGTRREPYPEDHPVNPQSVYATSKAAGEWMVRNASNDHLVIRTAALLGRAGTSGKGGNFAETMLRLAREGKPIRVVNDQVTAPTHTLDVASRTWDLVGHGATGVAHLTSTGQITWCEFTRHLFGTLGIEAEVTGVTSREFGAAAPRPACSLLAHDTLRRLGLPGMPSWQAAVESYLRRKGHTS